MPLSPRRRRRALQAHQLRDQGLSLRQIAQHLHISHTTVHHDLLALETNWPEIAQSAVAEHTMRVVQLSRQRLETLAREGPLGPFHRVQTRTPDGLIYPAAQLLSDASLIRLHELHERALHNAARQLLNAVKQLGRTAPDQIAPNADHAPWSDDQLPFPLEELADAELPNAALPDDQPPALNPPTAPDNTLTEPNTPNQTLTNPTTPNHLQPPRPDSAAPQTAAPTTAQHPNRPTTTLHETRAQRRLAQRQAQRQAERQARKARKQLRRRPRAPAPTPS